MNRTMVWRYTTLMIVGFLCTFCHSDGKVQGLSKCETSLRQLDPSPAKCALDTTCNVHPLDSIPHCNVDYGYDCRDTLLPKKPIKVEGRSYDDTPKITKLGVRSEIIDGFQMSNFYIEIAVSAEDINNNEITSLKMEFKSVDKDHNCIYKKMPSCRLFKFSEQTTDKTMISREKLPKYPTKQPVIYTFLNPAKPDLPSKQEKSNRKSNEKSNGTLQKYPQNPFWRRDKRQTEDRTVFISHSCFGMNVQRGNFEIRLTPFPELEPLVYRISWLESDAGIWLEEIIGVASVPGANQIHVVIQQPKGTRRNPKIHLELWNTTSVVDKTTISANESNAIFREVPIGLYRVLVIPRGYRCALSLTCPQFQSEYVLVNSKKMEQRPTVAEKANPVKKTVISLQLALFISTVVIVSIIIIISVVYCWRKKLYGRKNSSSVLVVSLDSGSLERKATQNLASALEDVLNLEMNTTQHGIEALGFELLEDHNQYKTIVLVTFLHELRQNQSSSGSVNAIADIYDALIKTLSRFPEKACKKMCIVGFTDKQSQRVPCLSDSSSLSRSDTSTVDIDDAITVLLQSSDTKKQKKRAPSTCGLRHLPILHRDSDNDNTIVLKYDFPQFFLPLEVLKFVKWLGSRHSSPALLKKLTFEVMKKNENWRIAQTCAQKVLLDYNERNYSYLKRERFNVNSISIDEMETISEDSSDVWVRRGLSTAEVHFTTPLTSVLPSKNEKEKQKREPYVIRELESTKQCSMDQTNLGKSVENRQRFGNVNINSDTLPGKDSESIQPPRTLEEIQGLARQSERKHEGDFKDWNLDLSELLKQLLME